MLKMPQENQVLRCFSCETFQVHIVKKARKWECKICGAKQSFTRHYGKGTGKDCRKHVMKLNELRVSNSYSAHQIEDEITEEPLPETEPVPVQKKSVSKWEQFLDEGNENKDIVFKQEKKRKMSQEHDEIQEVCKALDADTGRFTGTQLNDIKSSKYSKRSHLEEVTTERKKSKNIFDSDLDNFDEFLNFT